MSGIANIPVAKPRPAGGKSPYTTDTPSMESIRAQGDAAFGQDPGIISKLWEMVFGTNETAPHAEQANMRMVDRPTKEYVDYAMEHGYGEWNPIAEYLQGNRPFNFTNVPLKSLNNVGEFIQSQAKKQMPSQDYLDEFRRTALLNTEQPLAELGWEPEKVYYNTYQPEGGRYDVRGFYDPNTDIMVKTDPIDDYNAIMTHESMHRGMDIIEGLEDWRDPIETYTPNTPARHKERDNYNYKEPLNSNREEALVLYLNRKNLGNDAERYLRNPEVKEFYEYLLKHSDEADEIEKLINDLANKELGKRYNEWAGAMD